MLAWQRAKGQLKNQSPGQESNLCDLGNTRSDNLPIERPSSPERTMCLIGPRALQSQWDTLSFQDNPAKQLVFYRTDTFREGGVSIRSLRIRHAYKIEAIKMAETRRRQIVPPNRSACVNRPLTFVISLISVQGDHAPFRQIQS